MIFEILAADAPATFKVGEFSFARPADWQWVEVNSVMRKAQLKISDASKKESVEDIFFFFGEGGGGLTQANIDRRLAQFSEPKDKLNSKVETTTAEGHKITCVQAGGNCQSGMPVVRKPRCPKRFSSAASSRAIKATSSSVSPAPSHWRNFPGRISQDASRMPQARSRQRVQIKHPDALRFAGRLPNNVGRPSLFAVATPGMNFGKARH